VSPTFLSADFNQYTFVTAKANQSRLKALRYGRQECLRYAKHVHPPLPAAGRDVPRSGS